MRVIHVIKDDEKQKVTSVVIRLLSFASPVQTILKKSLPKPKAQCRAILHIILSIYHRHSSLQTLGLFQEPLNFPAVRAGQCGSGLIGPIQLDKRHARGIQHGASLREFRSAAVGTGDFFPARGVFPRPERFSKGRCGSFQCVPKIRHSVPPRYEYEIFFKSLVINSKCMIFPLFVHSPPGPPLLS
jgi:hypothetical protein